MNAKWRGERKAISAVFGKGEEEGKIKRKTNNLTDEQISANELKEQKYFYLLLPGPLLFVLLDLNRLNMVGNWCLTKNLATSQRLSCYYLAMS